MRASHDAIIVKTHEIISTHYPKERKARDSLQKAGERLDRKTKGSWVSDALVRDGEKWPEDSILVIDSVRIEGQIDALRKSYGAIVTHLHLTAPGNELASRYKKSESEITELKSYKKTQENTTERNVNKLAKIADSVVDTHNCNIFDVHERALAHLKLHPPIHPACVDVIIGGQYGSEGKGNIVGYLAREYEYLIRVGGANAGHKVYSEPEPITFRLLPSGTRHSEAKLIIGPGAVLRLDVLLKEIADFKVPVGRLFIDPQAMIVEEWDIKKEENLAKTISSTKSGTGSATARKIMGRSGKIRPQVRLAKDINRLKHYIKPTIDVLRKAYEEGAKIMLEGTQGTSLSIHHGEYPYVTSRDATVSGCLSEVGIPPAMVRKVIMVCRTYPIRVGNTKTAYSGNFQGKEISKEEIAKRSGVSIEDIEKTETTTNTKKQRRISEFSWKQLRVSAQLNCPTDIALTFVDYLDVKNRNARRYEQLEEETIRFIEEVERVTGVPVTLISTRFHHRNIIDRRPW